MINPEELRIGSWIQHTNSNGTFLLRVVDPSPKGATVAFAGGHLWIPFEELDPIPLAASLMPACGFVPMSADCFEHQMLRALSVRFGCDGRHHIRINGSGIDLAENMPLHRLQTLYWSLTGKEMDTPQ